MQMASAIDESMLQCTEPSDFSSMITCGLQPLLEFGDGSSARGSLHTQLVEVGSCYNCSHPIQVPGRVGGPQTELAGGLGWDVRAHDS
jgi:hypothetical protein